MQVGQNLSIFSEQSEDKAFSKLNDPDDLQKLDQGQHNPII